MADTGSGARTDGVWLVIGGTGGLGRRIVEALAGTGLRVRAFGRRADTEVPPSDRIEPCAGNALVAEDVTRALEGVAGVVQCLGIKERPAMVWETETLFSHATAILLPAMQAAGVSRLVAVTGYGAGDSADTMSAVVRLGHEALLGRVYEDKTRQEEMIRASGTDWTIVRPTMLTDGKLSRRYKVLREPESWHMGVVSRSDVAHFIAQVGPANGYLREAVVLA